MKTKRKFRRPKVPDVRRIWNFLLAMSLDTVLTVLAVAVLGGLMLWRLGSLLPGLSAAEVNTFMSASSLQAIADNAVNAPYKLAVYVSTHIFDSAFGLRLVGGVIGIISVIIFYLIARRLFSRNIAVASTAMLATNSLFLNVTRQATANVMLLSLLALIGAGFYLRFGKRPDIGWIAAAAVIGLSLYVPGMAFFIAAAVLWQFRHARKTFEQLKTPVITTASVTLGVLIAPLILSLILNFSLWRAYLGFPEQFAPISEMIKYAGTAVLSLYARTPHEPSWWLGRQPIMDIFTAFMFTYGAFVLLRQYKLDRLWTIGGVFLLSLLWIGATGNRLAVVILIPFVYLVTAVGLQWFDNRWTSVFPRNPIARWTGGLLLFGAIVLAVNFQSHRYFTAWPNNDQTKAQFSHQLPR